jgi:cell division protein FtsQ
VADGRTSLLSRGRGVRDWLGLADAEGALPDPSPMPPPGRRGVLADRVTRRLASSGAGASGRGASSGSAWHPGQAVTSGSGSHPGQAATAAGASRRPGRPGADAGPSRRAATTPGPAAVEPTSPRRPISRGRAAATDRHPAKGRGRTSPGWGRMGAVAAGAVAAATDADWWPPRLRIDPRIRARRIAVQREEGRKRLRLLVAGTVLLVAVAAGFGLSRTTYFAVHHIDVVGNQHASAMSLVTTAGLDTTPLMVSLNLPRMDAAMDRLPWVDRATVSRQWPDSLRITVTERVPVGVVGAPGYQMLVDGSGRILGPAPLTSDLPVVEVEASRGGDTVPPAGGSLVAAYGPALATAAAFPPALVPRVVTVVAEPGGTVLLDLAGGASAELGPPTQLASKLIAVLTLVEKVNLGTSRIDATVPSAPVLTDGSGVATFSTLTGG